MPNIFSRIFNAILSALPTVATGLLCYFGGTYEIMWLSIAGIVSLIISLLIYAYDRGYVWTFVISFLVIQILIVMLGNWFLAHSNTIFTWLIGHGANNFFTSVRAVSLACAFTFIFHDIRKISGTIFED